MQKIPEGYREVTVPDGYKGKIVTKDEDGNRMLAKPGDKVILSNKTLKSDPHLAQFATDATETEKKDFYSKATTESLKDALKSRDVKNADKMDRNALINSAREQGVERQELDFLEVTEKPKPVAQPKK